MEAEPSRSLLEMSDVAMTYVGSGRVEVLKGLTLTLGYGESVAIRGRSGAGKSTLLDLIGMLRSPTAGNYTFEGRAVGPLSESDRASIRARRIGFVFQAFHLLSGQSVLANIELGMLHTVPRAERRRQARAAAEAVGLGHRLHHAPAELSGGERQRVALARAIAPRPALLLADEPTGNLDPDTAEEVLGLFLDRKRAGASVIVVTHSVQVSRRCDRVLVLENGTLADENTSP